MFKKKGALTKNNIWLHCHVFNFETVQQGLPSSIEPACSMTLMVSTVAAAYVQHFAQRNHVDNSFFWAGCLFWKCCGPQKGPNLFINPYTKPIIQELSK